MKNDGMWWWYLIPFCLAVVGLTQQYCNYRKKTTEQVEEPAVEAVKTVATEQKKTEIPVGKIKCVHGANHDFCMEYVIYRTIGE